MNIVHYDPSTVTGGGGWSGDGEEEVRDGGVGLGSGVARPSRDPDCEVFYLHV